MSDTPQAHIERWLQRAILRVTAYLTGVGGGGVLDRYAFLRPYIDSARQRLSPVPTLAELDAAWGEAVNEADAAMPDHSDLPLVRLRRAGLTRDHLLALMLVGLVELDARFSTVYSALHPFSDELRITVGLLDDLLRFNVSGTVPSGWDIICDLEQRGLVTLHHPERPRAARAVSVPAPVWDACLGGPVTWDSSAFARYPAADFVSLADLQGLLPADILERLSRMPELAANGLLKGVILRGMRGSGRLRALGGVAQALGRDVLHLRCDEPAQIAPVCRVAGPLALLLDALPVIDLELAPGEILTLPPLAGYEGLAGIILNREGSVRGPLAERCVTFHLPAPDYDARLRGWSQALDASVNGTGAVIDAVSRNYHLTLGGVERAGQLARAYAALDGRAHIEIADVQEACRALSQQTLENLATRIHTTCDWDNLIISEGTQAELDNLIMRCRQREAVLAHLGRGFKGTTRGVRALFSGPSGTGKTLAARIVAAELGLDLYRVELSSVVSKYIGETERNLSQLFARAEEQDVVLLLDEGDSLLTARTDVRNSTDRYANMETNYLLQRLEQYEGIILITTNAADRIDSAFQRRMDVFVEFSLPDAGQRQQLWRLHLPERHTISNSFLRTVALRCQLTGGQIRNAALHATVLALEADEPVGETFLADGIQREYTKIGAVTPLPY
jgi:hypothetical protein